MKHTSFGEWLLYGAVCAYLLIIFLLPSEAWLGFTINALIVTILSVAWNLMADSAVRCRSAMRRCLAPALM